jgi:NAD(P)-dependent dehydrogenase (short-subunit alcohol dehydrogenase family)
MTHAAMSLDGKRVIVIGGASGIGFAVAALSRELGARRHKPKLGQSK